LEEIARAAYDRCHPDDSFEDLKHRAAFSKEDRMLLRDWLAAASAPLPQAGQNTTSGTKPDIRR
jgi:hypothetical protein